MSIQLISSLKCFFRDSLLTFFCSVYPQGRDALKEQRPDAAGSRAGLQPFPPCDYHLMRPCPPYHYPFPAKADVVLLPCPPWHYHCVQEQGGNAAIPTWPLPPSFQEQGGNAAIPTWQVPLCSQGQGNNAASPTLS